MKRIARIAATVLGGLTAIAFTYAIVLAIVHSPLYAWRLAAWGPADPLDIGRFSSRPIPAGGVPSPLPEALGALPENVTWTYEGRSYTENLQELIERSGTAAFIVVKDDAILFQRYLDGDMATLRTSFSVAKSVVSALIGAAIEDGYIGSVDDPVIRYLPELTGRGLDAMTIRNLLRMDSGIEYREDENLPFFMAPFSDDALSYYAPDLRKVALSVRADSKSSHFQSDSPSAAFHYNNYHPLLEGLILERATGKTVAAYLGERLWEPLGAAYPASWSLDSARSGFEKMESGFNAAAVDYARFGLLYLHGGRLDGKQILSEAWISESTAPDPQDRRSWETYGDFPAYGGYYGYHWWGLENPDGSCDFSAIGNFWQLVYVAPRKNMVIVRLGASEGDEVYWPLVLKGLVDALQ